VTCLSSISDYLASNAVGVASLWEPESWLCGPGPVTSITWDVSRAWLACNRYKKASSTWSKPAVDNCFAEQTSKKKYFSCNRALEVHNQVSTNKNITI